MFPNGVFLTWIFLIFPFKLCFGIHGAINICYIDLYIDLFTIRNSLPLLCYIAVADMFTRTEITYI